MVGMQTNFYGNKYNINALLLYVIDYLEKWSNHTTGLFLGVKTPFKLDLFVP